MSLKNFLFDKWENEKYCLKAVKRDKNATKYVDKVCR